MKKQGKAVVVFSGGQDSTTCLFWALERFEEVVAVTFDYNQRHRLEIECAQEIAKDLGVEHHILNLELLNQLAPNALTRDDIEVAKGKDGGLPSTFVDGRNHLFLSFVAVLAKNIGAKHIVTGVCASDDAGYPDTRDVFIKSLNVTLNLAMDYDFVIETPLMWVDKQETWAMADRLGKLDYVVENTLTCYNGIKGFGCGHCPSCELRARGLNAHLKATDENAKNY